MRPSLNKNEKSKSLIVLENSTDFYIKIIKLLNIKNYLQQTQHGLNS